MITKNQLNQIKKFSLHLDWNIAFGGKSKGNRHLFRVTKIALRLNKTEGGNRSVIEASAWLHNVGLIKGDKGHDRTGKKIAKEFLTSINVDKNDIYKILHCIEAHEGYVRANSLEAQIVHDSDVIEKMGPLGIIRQTWKLSNSGVTTERICKMLKPYIERRRKNIYTKTARIMANDLNKRLDGFLETLNRQINY